MRIALFTLILVLAGCGSDSSVPSPATSTQTAQPGPVVFIGDSITAGWKLPEGVINAGISGQTSDQMLARFQTDVLSHHPSVVHILAGTNDVRIFNPANVNSIAEMAQEAAAAGAKVIIGTIPPDTQWPYSDFITSQDQMTQITLAFNSQLALLSLAYGYHFVDYYPLFLNPDGTINLSLYVDGTHPTDAAHVLMWNLVQPLL